VDLFIPDIRAEDDFSKRYQTYQKVVSSGKASLNKKDYQAAIEHYTRAIEMYPFCGVSLLRVALLCIGKVRNEA